MIRKIWFTVLFFIAAQTFGQSLSKDTIPAELYGEWYNKKNGDLLCGFYNKAVVYHEQVWKYDAIKKKGKQALVEISNDSGQKVTLKVKIRKSAISVSSSDGGLTACTNKLSDCHITHDLPEFTEPVLKQDTIYFSGYIVDYNGGEDKVSLGTDDLLGGGYKNYRTDVQPNGYFSIKIPQTHPVVLLATTPVCPIFPYIEPGKNLFVILAPDNRIVYAGDGAPLAREDQMLRNSNRAYLPYLSNFYADIKGMTPEQYKNYFIAVQRKAESFIDSLFAAKSISPRIYQMHKLDIRFTIAQYLLSYNQSMQQIHNSNGQQYTPAELPYAYFDFLDSIGSTDLAPVAQAYPKFIEFFNLSSGDANLLNRAFKINQDSLNQYLGSIEAVADVFHVLQHKKQLADDNEISLLNTIYALKGRDAERKKLIADNQDAVNAILGKCSAMSMVYVIANLATNYLCDSLHWKRGISTDLIVAANITRQIIHQNTKLPDDFFDTKASLFANPVIARYMKELNDHSQPVIQTKLPGFVNDWSYIGKEGIVSNDTIHKNGYTLIFVSKYQTFPDSTKTKMIDAFFKVYPEEAAIYNSLAPKHVTFVIDPEYTGVAASADSLTRFNPKWYEQNPNDIDVVTHEVMHIVQAYNKNHYQPSWVTEGIADFVRYTLGVNNTAANWSLTPFNTSQSYTNAYRITARFFVWIVNKYDKDFVKKLDAAMRDNAYDNTFWNKTTGKSVDELWSEYAANPAITALR